jgi:hypothetical protein
MECPAAGAILVAQGFLLATEPMAMVIAAMKSVGVRVAYDRAPSSAARARGPEQLAKRPGVSSQWNATINLVAAGS